MESKKTVAATGIKPYLSNVSFAVPSMKTNIADSQPLIIKASSLRQDSLGVVSQSSLHGRRESTLGLLMPGNKASLHTGGLTGPDPGQDVVKCLFRARWKILSYLQIICGLLAITVSLFSKSIPANQKDGLC